MCLCKTGLVLFMLCIHIVLCGKVLELFEEPGGIPAQLYEVHHQSVVSTLPLHCGLRSAGNAAIWWTVSHFQTCWSVFVVKVCFPV